MGLLYLMVASLLFGIAYIFYRVYQLDSMMSDIEDQTNDILKQIKGE